MFTKRSQKYAFVGYYCIAFRFIHTRTHYTAMVVQLNSKRSREKWPLCVSFAFSIFEIKWHNDSVSLNCWSAGWLWVLSCACYVWAQGLVSSHFTCNVKDDADEWRSQTKSKCTTKSIIIVNQLYFLYIFQFIGSMRCVRPHEAHTDAHTDVVKKINFLVVIFFILIVFRNYKPFIGQRTLSFQSVCVSALDCTIHKILNIEYHKLYLLHGCY